MAIYQSNTPQVQHRNAWTFAGLAVDQAGDCFVAERNGLRDIKAKGLIVRYPNPFGKGGEPEVLYESTTDSPQSLVRTASGALHMFGKKHHFLDGGKWKSKAVQAKGEVMRGYAAGETVYLMQGWPDAFIASPKPGEYNVVDTGLKGHPSAISGTGPADIWAAADDGLAHFDGTTWTVIENAPKPGTLLCRSHDEVLLTGNDREQGLVAALYRGNATQGFSPWIFANKCANGGRFDVIFEALGKVFLTQTHDSERGLYCPAGDGVEKIMNTTGFCTVAGGNAEVLWHSNGIELLCFNGKQWKQVPRIWHDKTKG